MIFVESEDQKGIKRRGIDLAVCILFYEKLDQTIECIQSFLPSGVNIYMLNNGSSLSTRQALGRFCSNYKQIKIFDSDVNLGVGVGRNYLVTHTTEEWLLFVDNDITVKTADWLQKITKYVSLYSDIEVFTPKLFDVHQNRFSWFNSIRIVDNKAIPDKEIIDDVTNFFPGGASFSNRKMFNRLGIYDDKMFVGGEDFELCIRGILSGSPVKARLIHDIVLVHDHRQAKKVEDKNATLIRYDLHLLETSFNRISEKHNITLVDNNWRPWAINQVETITKTPTHTFWNSWKLKIKSIVKRLLRKGR